MAVYFCADGGGTKLLMLAFDEELRLLATARGAGVSTLIATPEQVKENMLGEVRAMMKEFSFEPTLYQLLGLDKEK